MVIETSKHTRKRNTAIPIKDRKSFDKIRKNLKNNPRDLLLFDLLTQTGININSILFLRVSNLKLISIGAEIHSTDDTTDGMPIMTEVVYNTLQQYLKTYNPDDNDFLFKSRKGTKPLKLNSVSHLVRKWYKEANLKNYSGISSLRKTWNFHNGQNRVRQIKASKKLRKIINPIEMTTLQDAVYRELKKSILSANIRPGDRLITEDLARQANVSETPVREALARLEIEGFLYKEKRKGHLIRTLSLLELKEILKIRLELETLAIRDSSLPFSPSLLKKLETNLFQNKLARKEGDIEKYVILNRQFHHMIYSNANMPTLKLIISYLWNRMSPYLNLLIRECNTYNPRLPMEFHQGMVNGVRNQDPGEVCTWLREDINQADKVLSIWFNQQQSEDRVTIKET